MRTIFVCLFFVTSAFAAFKFGQFNQDAKNGYKSRVSSETEYETPHGILKLKNVNEIVGLGFLEPSKQILIFEPLGAASITIYKSQSGFQEHFPNVETVRVENGDILWADGIFTYRLSMERIKNRTEMQKIKSSGWSD